MFLTLTPASSSFFLLAFIDDHSTSYGRKYPLGQFGLAVPAMLPTNLLSTFSLLAFIVDSGWRDSLVAVQA